MIEGKSKALVVVIVCLVINFIVLGGLVYKTIVLTNKVGRIENWQRKISPNTAQAKIQRKRDPIEASLVEEDIKKLGGFLTLYGDPGNRWVKFKLINASELTITSVTIQINFQSDIEDSNKMRMPYDLYTFHFLGVKPGETDIQSVKMDYDWSEYPKHTWKIYAAQGSWQLP
jgi:hypothetical protein